jgi:glutathione S-transferase
MITLYTFPPAFGLRNVSPFCLKVEMALHHLQLDYTIEELSNPAKAPKGKLPYIVADGQTITDSELILDYLDKSNGGKLYGNLSGEQLAQGFAYVRLVEDHLYWMIVASRWLDDSWWPNVDKGFFGSLPFPLRQLVPMIARSRIKKTYKLHGLGLHSLEEQKEFARKDLHSLNEIIKGKTYLMGDEISVFDFAVASMLAGALDNQPGTWVTAIAKNFVPLVEYTERVQRNVGIFGREIIMATGD